MNAKLAGKVLLSFALLWGWPAAGETKTTGHVMTKEYFVAPDGSDTNPGTRGENRGQTYTIHYCGDVWSAKCIVYV